MTRRRGWLLGAGIGVVLLILAAGVWVWQSPKTPRTAEEAALAYLQALESGDADAVATTGIAVSDEVLAAFTGATAFISQAAVTGIDQRGETATAEASFRLGDEDRSATLTLARKDGVWLPEPSALGGVKATLRVGSFATIGGAAFPVDDSILLLPASYELVAAPADLLDGTAAAHVLPGEDVAVEIDVAVRDAATEAAQAVLDEHLAQCTAAGGAPAAGCGIRTPWGVEFREVSDVAYRIETLPTIAVTATAFAAGEGVLIATVTGTGQDGTARTTTYRTDDWKVRGDVSFTETGIDLAVW